MLAAIFEEYVLAYPVQYMRILPSLSRRFDACHVHSKLSAVNVFQFQKHFLRGKKVVQKLNCKGIEYIRSTMRVHAVKFPFAAFSRNETDFFLENERN